MLPDPKADRVCAILLWFRDLAVHARAAAQNIRPPDVLNACFRIVFSPWPGVRLLVLLAHWPVPKLRSRVAMTILQLGGLHLAR